MSKVFRFFRFVLLFTLLTLVLLTIEIKPTFAIQEIQYKGITLTIDHANDQTEDKYKKPITTQDSWVTFSVSAATDNAFGSNIEYKAYFFRNNLNDNKPCFSDNKGATYISPQTPRSTGNLLLFRYSPTGVCKEIGTYHFMMFAGGTGWANVPNDLIMVPDYPFEIEQPGTGHLDLQPINPAPPLDLGPNDIPQVMLVNARKNTKYEFWWEGSGEYALNIPITKDDNIPLDIPIKGIDLNPGKKTLCMEVGDDRVFENRIIPGTKCRFHLEYNLQAVSKPPSSPPSGPAPGSPGSCNIKPYAAHLPTLKEGDSLTVVISKLPTSQSFQTELTTEKGDWVITPQPKTSDPKGTITLSLKDHMDIGKYKIIVNTTDTNKQKLCELPLFEVNKDGSTIDDTTPGRCTDKDVVCTEVGKDSTCGSDKNPGIKTAVGCIHTSPPELVKDVMTFMLGISGGLAFLMMLLGAFQMLTSAGNPETLHAGRERLTSAIIGLLIVIFATLLLQIIGVDILRIPGFG